MSINHTSTKMQVGIHITRGDQVGHVLIMEGASTANGIESYRTVGNVSVPIGSLKQGLASLSKDLNLADVLNEAEQERVVDDIVAQPPFSRIKDLAAQPVHLKKLAIEGHLQGQHHFRIGLDFSDLSHEEMQLLDCIPLKRLGVQLSFAITQSGAAD